MLKNKPLINIIKSYLVYSLLLTQAPLLQAASSINAAPLTIEVFAKNMGIKRLSDNEPQALTRIEDKSIPEGFKYILQTSLIIKAAQNFHLDNSLIITNGHSLLIEANDTISAKGAVIKSFEEKAVSTIAPQKPKDPEKAGKDGLPGVKGADGKSANLVHLKATHIDGSLTILNNGQDGGPGGPGGNGSVPGIKGANGKDYAPEKSLGDAGKLWKKMTGNQAMLRPETQSTLGERGSPSGLPGPAGSGGNGGNAGPTILNAESFAFTLFSSQKGGQGGLAARNSQKILDHGLAGAAGLGGNGGRKKDGTLEDSLGIGASASAADHPRAEIYQKIISGEFSKDGKNGSSDMPKIKSAEEDETKLPKGLSLKFLNAAQ